jgi:GNAT superfamily N-acetyltransferase
MSAIEPRAIEPRAIELRPATRDDLPMLVALADASIGRLQRAFLDESQIVASRRIMGVDTQLVEDGTYVVAECAGRVVGCGGWSRRRTMYGGDHTAGRDDGLLDPNVDAARVRAMYTHPDWARRGIGRRILEWCELAASAEGFGRLELVATLAGQPLYEAAGFTVDEELVDRSAGTDVPLRRMHKRIDRSASPSSVTVGRRAGPSPASGGRTPRP